MAAQQEVMDWFSFWLKGEENRDPQKREQNDPRRELPNEREEEILAAKEKEVSQHKRQEMISRPCGAVTGWRQEEGRSANLGAPLPGYSSA